MALLIVLLTSPNFLLPNSVGAGEFPRNTNGIISTPVCPVIQEFGLPWNAALRGLRILVGDEVPITLDIEFVKN